MSKQFLKGCFTGTLHALKEKNYWRDTFTDQLGIAYRQFLTQEVEDQSTKYDQTEELVDSMVETEVTLLAQEKEEIMQRQIEKQLWKADTRVIESVDKRIVHFLFNPLGTSTKMTPFTRKLKLMLDGELEQFEKEEHEKFENFLQSYVDESLGEDDAFPVVYPKNVFSEMAL